MITSMIASVSEFTMRSGMGVVETVKKGSAAWKVGKLAAMQPKADKPTGMSEDYIARVRAIAEERGLDIDDNPSKW